MTNRIFLAALLSLASATASAGGNCNYPRLPASADAMSRATHQRQLLEGASDKLKQYCASAAEAKGGSPETCLIFRGYLRELCNGADYGFPVAVDDKYAQFVTDEELDVLLKLAPKKQ